MKAKTIAIPAPEQSLHNCGTIHFVFVVARDGTQQTITERKKSKSD
jgi:hypothetical protein